MSPGTDYKYEHFYIYCDIKKRRRPITSKTCVNSVVALGSAGRKVTEVLVTANSTTAVGSEKGERGHTFCVRRLCTARGSQLWLNVSNAELFPKRDWRGPRFQEVSMSVSCLLVGWLVRLVYNADLSLARGTGGDQDPRRWGKKETIPITTLENLFEPEKIILHFVTTTENDSALRRAVTRAILIFRHYLRGAKSQDSVHTSQAVFHGP